MEDHEWRKDDHLRTAHRAALLRRHSLFPGGCRLYHAAVDGSRIALADRRRVPRIRGKSSNRGFAEEPRPSHFPCSNRWPGPTLRSVGDYVLEVSAKRNGSARTLLRWRK